MFKFTTKQLSPYKKKLSELMFASIATAPDFTCPKYIAHRDGLAEQECNECNYHKAIDELVKFKKTRKST